MASNRKRPFCSQDGFFRLLVLFETLISRSSAIKTICRLPMNHIAFLSLLHPNVPFNLFHRLSRLTIEIKSAT